MCAAGVGAPSLMRAGTSSATITMYAGVVGIPIPSTMPASAVRTSARTSAFWASPTTACVKVMPRPVMVTQPITIPAQAHAIATASVFFAPSSSASNTERQVMPARVVARASATGMQASAPASAHSGAE